MPNRSPAGRLVAALFLMLGLALAAAPAMAQSTEADIIARQKALQAGEDPTPRFTAPDLGEPPVRDAAGSALGAQGGASDADLWRVIRAGESEDLTVAGTGSPIMIQSQGESWRQSRTGPLPAYLGYAMLGMLALLFLFFLVRGRIKVEGGLSGEKVERFKFIERFGHWLLAVSFIILALSGLNLLYGRRALYTLYGDDPAARLEANQLYAQVALWGKWAHNNVAWAFMLGLVMIFFMWVLRNIPSWRDVVWLAKGGGIIGNAHVSAKKFNAGQKIIFWLVILLGASVSATGLALMFPGMFNFGLFQHSFSLAHNTGLAGVTESSLGLSVPQSVNAMEELQLAQLWHTIVSVVMIIIVFAHIYIGSVGMQGAFAAMGSGKVDRNWAEEHHDLWLDEVDAKDRRRSAAGAAAE